MLKLAGGLIARGYPVDLVLIRDEGVLSDLIPEAATVVRLHGLGVAASIPRLATYLRTRRPAWLISALTHVNLAALLARALSGAQVRTMVTEHTQISRRARSAASLSERLTYALTPSLYRHAGRVVAVSDGAAEDLSAFARLPPGRVQRIYNPVFDDALLTASQAQVDHPWLDSGGPLLLAAGRLEPVKGFDNLIRAFAILRQSLDCRLIILGEGRMKASLQALATDLGVAGDLSLPGFAANPYAYMARTDAFVVSSRIEGLSLVLIEALACGASVVSTDCPSGPREILADGAFGALVPVDDPAALAGALQDALSRPRGQHADRAKAFSVAAAVQAYIDLF